jgi:hypothetical protein
MSWTEPKTDWNPGDGVKASDFNRIEGNIAALSVGTYIMKGIQTGTVSFPYPSVEKNYELLDRLFIEVPRGKQLILVNLRAVFYAQDASWKGIRITANEYTGNVQSPSFGQETFLYDSPRFGEEKKNYIFTTQSERVLISGSDSVRFYLLNLRYRTYVDDSWHIAAHARLLVA